MGKVTALDMDPITEKSGHVVAPVAPSVCLTPAAPAPVPGPFPVTGTSAAGLDGTPSRTRIEGAKVGTVGGSFSAVHGNEPGTLKEVISLTTGGPAPIILGAPTVLIEKGMAGITGSALMANRGVGPSGRTAPAPAAGVASVPAAAVLGGGGDGGDENGEGNGDGSGGTGGAGGGGASRNKNAPAGQDGQCSGGHPVDVVTGRAYTLPAVDLELPGPLPLVFARVYSTTARERDVGLGFGWAHTFGWEIERRRRALVVWSDEGIATEFPPLAPGAEHVGAWGWALRAERERLVLDIGDGVRRVFAADERARRWRLMEIRDRNDNRIELIYDEAGRLAELLDSAGRTVRVATTPAGRIAELHIYDARGRGRRIHVARYDYSDGGDLVTAVDAEGHARRYAYDDAHRLTRETDRTGLTFCFVYDRAGRCAETWGEHSGEPDLSLAAGVAVTLADDTRAKGIHHVKLAYGPDRYTEVADSTQIRRYFGNRHGLVDKRIEGSGVEESSYDERGLLLTRTDGEGAVTRYERDARGRVVRVIDPLERVTTYARDDEGLAIQVVDPAGGAYAIDRDARGNVLHEADPTGATTSYTHDARGLVTSITSPTGGVTRFAYDAQGNLVERTEPTGARWRWSYDLLGRRVREIDPLGHETRFTWTARGDLAAVFDAAGGVRRYGYDGERRLCDLEGPGRRTIGLVWGGYFKLAEKTDAAGETVKLRYNREGELVEVENEKGEIHALTRDGAGRVVREDTFDGRRLTYQYGRVGRLVRSEVAGEVTRFVYDAAGQLVARRLDDETVETLAYNLRGELVRMAWLGGELRFERDAAGRVLREIQILGSEEHAVASLYDANGARVRRSTSRGHHEQIERDAGGARRRTILDEAHDVRHAHNPLGREAARALPRGGCLRRAYDPLGRLVHRSVTASGTLQPVRVEDPAWASATAPAHPDRVIAECDYQYDGDGELSGARDRRWGQRQFAYDAVGRLLSVRQAAAGREERFRYDAAGNHEAVDEPRAYGRGGRLLRRGDAEYVWDEAGRLREKRAGGGAYRYAWDAAGRLASVSAAGGRRVEYSYDPMARRLESRIYEAPSPLERACLVERIRFVWDGDVLAHAIRTRTMAGVDPVIEEQTFCFEDGGFVPWAQCDDLPDGYGGRRRAWVFHVNDPIGTPDALVGPDGSVLAELDRQAWGRTEAVGGARADTPLRFQGQYEDREAGLFYNRFRYYEPEAGLYLSPDPLGLSGGLRLYGYGINPLRWVDPLGLAFFIVDASGQCAVLGTKSELKAMGVKDGHHIIQDAAVRGLPGYTYNGAPCIGLPGPATASGTPHNRATMAQRNCKGGGTLGQEAAIGESALVAAGTGPDIAKTATEYAEAAFAAKGLGPSRQTQTPANRR